MSGPNKRAGETGSNLRPSQAFTDHRKEQYLLELSRTGQIVASAYVVGVCKQTITNHRDKDVAFADAVLEAIDRYRDSIDAEIRRRGVEGVEEPVFYQGRVAGWVRKYSDALLIEHAKAHDPRYRNKLKLDAVVSGGVLVVPAAPANQEAWTKRFSGVEAQN